MFIEIERKFEFTDDDYSIIQAKLIKESDKTIEDIYKDLPDFYLIHNKMKFRIRNWKKELKIKVWNISSEEYYEEDAIQKLLSLEIEYKDLTKEICTIVTKREKYIWEYDWFEYVIDVDRHGWGSKYEIEVQCENESVGYNIIDGIRKDLWLKSTEVKVKNQKLMSNLKIQNPDLYRKLLNDG